METISARLLAFREKTDLSKKAFADKIGMDSGLYGRYEAGQNKPSIETLEKIVLTFPKLNATWLISGKGEMLMTTEPPVAENLAPVLVPQSDLTEQERTSYWKQVAEERGRLLEQAQEREQRLWKQIDSFPSGNAESAEHQANRAKMSAHAA